MRILALHLLLLLAWAPAQTLPELRVTADDTLVDRSCRLVFPTTPIHDAAGDGVVIVRGAGLLIEVARGPRLTGGPADTPGDRLTGIGVRIDGGRDVTLRGLAVSRFRVGLVARGVDGLVLEDADFDDLYRQRLGSTPAAEDPADWLSPHRNDENEWLTHYGASIWIEECTGVVVRRCRVRGAQNGLILDTTDGARIYDNDLSFLSGWGLALWRASRNVITRNALDFCVRGYSHGIYNRGQDSAGLLLFEQCCENLIAENSITHGGDGLFAFAGREALGEGAAPTASFDYRRRGNDDNVVIGNDLSHAAAHGIEITFSFGNRVLRNRVVDNAICGVWGGYSQDTTIAENRFEGNGGMAYGLERGGVDIEHGKRNRILANTFVRNRCGVHLWWDADEGLLATPWAQANGADVRDNAIADNVFTGEEIAVQLRDCGGVTFIADNRFDGCPRELEADAGSPVSATTGSREHAVPVYEALGLTRPVGARAHLRGRDRIIMTEWGPWDHESVIVHELGSGPGWREFRRLPWDAAVALETSGEGVRWSETSPGVWRVAATGPGVHSFAARAGAAGVRGELVSASWDVVFFPWTVDPREDLAGWRREAGGARAVRTTTPELTLRFAMGGPGDVDLDPAIAAAAPGRDRFGTIARTRLPLPRGRWRLETLSDDGVRVRVGEEIVIDNWTWHGPTRNDGVLELPADAEVEILVEHFELDGYAVLEFGITRIP